MSYEDQLRRLHAALDWVSQLVYLRLSGRAWSDPRLNLYNLRLQLSQEGGQYITNFLRTRVESLSAGELTVRPMHPHSVQHITQAPHHPDNIYGVRCFVGTPEGPVAPQEGTFVFVVGPANPCYLGFVYP